MDHDGWKTRHDAAMRNPNGDGERAIVYLAEGIRLYALQYHKDCGMPIGEDNVLGPAFDNLTKGFLALLDGEVGRRLDRGILAEVVDSIRLQNGLEL